MEEILDAAVLHWAVTIAWMIQENAFQDDVYKMVAILSRAPFY